jgi:hypothetical protein
MDKTKFICTVCGHKTLQTKGHYEICPVCFWEDEGDIEDFSQPTYGPNGSLSVEKARINYELFGAVNKKFAVNVRPPLAEELVDSGDDL